MNYKINIDYDIDKLINIIVNTSGIERLKYKREILDGSDNLGDFKHKAALMGTRITLKNELKISDTEALNYLMGFPLNFKLESLVKMLFDTIKANKSSKFNFDKIEYLISQKKETTEDGHIARLKLDFDKKKKLISQNFESTTHIDKQEFLDWAESRGFIEKSQ